MLFYLLMSIVTLMTAKNITNSHKFAMRSYALNSQESENLKIILNYIQNKQDFYPSIVSLLFSDVRSNYADLVSNYIASKSIVNYKITIDDLSQNNAWQNRIDLTWIFVIDNINILNTFIYEQKHIWKTTNQYLIINTTPSITMLLREILQIMWKNYNIYKIVIISIQDDFQCLSIYSPFEKNRWDEYGIIRKICGLMEYEKNIELYTNFKNLNGYPIHIVVFPSLMMNVTYDENIKKSKFSRLDANAMLLLEKEMEAKFLVNVIYPLPNEDPFQRTLQYIESGKAEVIITSFFIHQYGEFKKYEFTVSLYEDKLCFIVPTSGFVPKSYMPIMPFTPDLWIVLMMYNVLVSILWFLIKYYSGLFRRQEVVLLPLTRTTEKFVFSIQQSDLSPRIHPYISSCFYFFEKLCYPLKEDSSTITTTSQRALLFGTLFFGLIIVGLYQSCLVSSLSNPFHYPELNTLEDVANSNFTIITKYQNLKQSVFLENTTLANKLRDKIKVIVTNKRTNDIIAFNKKAIAIGRYSSYKLDDLSNYSDADGNELFHIVEEYPYTYLLSYVVKLYSPYRERINELLLRMREAGLIKLWYENMAYPMYEAEQKRKMAKSQRNIKLTMKHYSLTFVGLLFGLLSCIVVFLAELYFAKKSRSLIKI